MPTTTPADQHWQSPPPPYETIVSNAHDTGEVYAGRSSKPRPDISRVRPGCSMTLSRASDRTRRRLFVAVLKAASNCRASLNDMEDLMLAGARIFELEVTLLRTRGTIRCLTGHRAEGCESKIEYSAGVDKPCNEFRIPDVHEILNAIATEDITIVDALDKLNEDFAEKIEEATVHNLVVHLIGVAFLSAMVCAVLSYGSIKASYTSAIGVVLLCILHIALRHRSIRNAQILTHCVVILIGLIAHDSPVAPSMPSIISVLPGYMYMCSVLKTQRVDIIREVEETALWIIYAGVLGSGLHILLDVVLVYNLVMLVVLAQDTFGKGTAVSLEIGHEWTVSGNVFGKSHLPRRGSIAEQYLQTLRV